MNLSDLFGGEAPVWVSGRTYTIGQVVRDPADWYFRYVRVAGGAGTTNPINDPGNWRPDGARPIRSIQRGSISIPSGGLEASVTISGVNMSKTELRHTGGGGSNSATGYSLNFALELINSTTIKATSTGGFTNGGFASWELTEYY